jgi:hypothetical protein
MEGADNMFFMRHYASPQRLKIVQEQIKNGRDRDTFVGSTGPFAKFAGCDSLSQSEEIDC